MIADANRNATQKIREYVQNRRKSEFVRLENRFFGCFFGFRDTFRSQIADLFAGGWPYLEPSLRFASSGIVSTLLAESAVSRPNATLLRPNATLLRPNATVLSPFAHVQISTYVESRSIF